MKSQYKLHRFTIAVDDWEVQKALTKVLGACLFVLVGLATFQAIYNNHLRKNALTEKVFLYENNGSIEIMQNAQDSVTEGDQILLQKYLSMFITAVESNHSQTMRAFASPQLFSNLRKRIDATQKTTQVKILNAFAIDENLQQVDYLVQKGDIKEKKNAVVKWRLLTKLQDYDTRLSITNFESLNPLKLEVTEYNSVKKLE